MKVLPTCEPARFSKSFSRMSASTTSAGPVTLGRMIPYSSSQAMASMSSAVIPVLSSFTRTKRVCPAAPSSFSIFPTKTLASAFS